MPVTHNIQILVDGQTVELGEIDELGLRISYALESSENFRQKQSSTVFSLSFPATPTNDQIFNTFHNPKVIDLSSNESYSDFRSCQIFVDGVEIITGKLLLNEASTTRLPEEYTVDIYGNNGDWCIDMSDLTIWDCVSTVPHDFTVANVEASWDNFDSDETHDYVYAPVRYRQPFGINDDKVNIYHLRPSISIYWLLVRGFRQFGYRIESQFLNTTNYFRRMVMPWTFGDLFDINSQLTDGISFKAVGAYPFDASTGNFAPPVSGIPTDNAYKGYGVWMALEPLATSGSLGAGTLTATIPQADTSFLHFDSAQIGSGDHYIKSTGGMTIPWTDGTTFNSLHNVQCNFRINYTQVPLGYDNFGLYSFDESTGTMKWVFAPPAPLSGFIGNNFTVNFTLNLYAFLSAAGGSHCDLYLEIAHYDSLSVLIGTTTTHIINATGAGQGGDNGCLGGGGSFVMGGVGLLNIPFMIPWIYNFSVPGINSGDYLKMRLKWNASGTAQDIAIASSFYLNTNPNVTGANPWQYTDSRQWINLAADATKPQWQYYQSSLTMTGLQVTVGGSVHFQFYDKLRSYRFMDLLTGLADLFDLSIQTNPITKVVTIEPTNSYVLPDGTQMPGYFKPERLDFTDKQDISKKTTNVLFSDFERQFDFSMKGDSSDGGANIFAARYKGIYLNNKVINPISNTNVENGIIPAIPGASRYLFPGRFRKGARQLTNSFFSPTMHYKHQKWANITTIMSGGTAPALAPQLICLIPENVSDTSASAITQTFEPKIAFYSGKEPINAVGGWQWCGQLDGRGYDSNGVGIPTYNDPTDFIPGQPLSVARSKGFELPYLFSTDYTGWAGSSPGTMGPVLTYSDQLINGVVKPGLMKTFFLKRLAIMRNGKQYKPHIRLNLGDIIDWEHRNTVIIDGALYHLIEIKDYNPLSDASSGCTVWMVANPDQSDLDSCYPSSTSILTNPTILPPSDLKYSQLLLFSTDIPQIG